MMTLEERSDSREVLRRLADELVAGTLSDAGRRQLQQVLESDEQARCDYLSWLDQEAQFRWRQRGQAADEPVQPAEAIPTPTPTLTLTLTLSNRTQTLRRAESRPFPRPRTRFSAALVLVVLIGLGVWWFQERPAAARVEATMSRAVNLQWKDGASPLEVGQSVTARPLRLAAGQCELTLVGGARLTVNAPADLSLEAGSRVILEQGHLVARVPRDTAPVTIETGAMRVSRAGAEFGVEVEPGGQTAVQVFEGETTVTWPDLAGGPAESLLVQAGQTIEMVPGRSPEPVPFDQRRFVREIAPLESQPHAQQYQPFNTPAVTSLQVARAPATVRVDGDLSDWQPARNFESHCRHPFENYRVAGRLMYDAERLYVGAHVGDPQPLRNTYAPHEDPLRNWQGGAVHVRLATDRRNPGPYEATILPYRRREGEDQPRPEDVSDEFVHLTLWYFAPEKRPCLQLDFGLDLHGTSVNPAGFAGAYQLDPDGLGYTLEYAIPWAALRAAAHHPQAGDELACTWQVHWSDDTGRRWKAHLVDVVTERINLENVFGRTAIWGRACYE